MSDITPMMRQYLDMKSQHPDAILFFRLGDFYEMFNDDAVKASKILDIALTTRNKNTNGNSVPLCGIPFHSSGPYIAKLVEAGEKVAICEQVEDPKIAKGIVRREVVKIITPGMVLAQECLSPNDNNYLLALYRGKYECWGFAYLDLSTGEFKVTEIDGLVSVKSETSAINPREIIVPASYRNNKDLLDITDNASNYHVTFIDDWVYDLDYSCRKISDQFNGATPEALGCQRLNSAILAVGAVLHYLHDTQKDNATHINKLTPYAVSDFLVLDETTRRNLELTSSLSDGKRKGSLLSVLDRTVTAMGSRMLRQWLNFPLTDSSTIILRQDAIAELMNKPDFCADVVKALKGVNDLERLNGRISMATANARDLVSLLESMQQVAKVQELLSKVDSPLLKHLNDNLDSLPELMELISRALICNPPLTLREGGFIADGYDELLDDLRSISREGKGFISRLEAKERQRTGISSLKIRYNKVFGYSIEVTKANLANIPIDYCRRQTLTNAERYITPELKEYEDKVIGAEERIIDREYELFLKIRLNAVAQGKAIALTAEKLAALDILLCFADIAHNRGYCRPQVDCSDMISITDGRHPVVEAMDFGERFVPNDVLLDNQENQLLIITGPNMAGKSTFLRQVALITLMAQIGCYVPAAEAKIGIVDRIFTRVGASDNLARGQSTFMVEMTETATILRQSTPGSLIILDEIGRGTSTFDGISIAWAVAEYLHDSNEHRAKTLFATHYHELTELAVTKPRVKNFNVAVREWQDQIIFLRKIVSGWASHSYGIQVGRLAGLPQEVVERAKEILVNLENGEFTDSGQPRIARGRKGSTIILDDQLSLFEDKGNALRLRLSEIDISNITPLQALMLLDELKRMI